jgi:hypothetical protein
VPIKFIDRNGLADRPTPEQPHITELRFFGGPQDYRECLLGWGASLTERKSRVRLGSRQIEILASSTRSLPTNRRDDLTLEQIPLWSKWPI